MNNTKSIYVLISFVKNLDKSELKAYLKERLPEYMIPSYFMEMDMIPLTNNGKINRNALPEPDATGLISSDYEAPQTVIQKELVAVWKNVLEWARSVFMITF